MILKFISTKLIYTPLYHRECIAVTILPVLKFNLRYAGHAHWQNVKATKDMKDKIKHTNSSLIANLVVKAVKEGNGVKDPKLNSKLAAAIERARSLSVPMSNIEDILSRTETIEPYIIEFQAPGGIFLLIESCNKNVIREKNLIQSILKRYGFKLTFNIINQIFNHKAEVICKSDKSHLTDEDKALEIALEVGAEEVKKDTDEETGKIIYKFSCNPRDLKKVEIALLEKCIDVDSSMDYYDPLATVKIDDDMKVIINEMISKINKDFDNVQRVFLNTV